LILSGDYFHPKKVKSIAKVTDKGTQRNNVVIKNDLPFINHSKTGFYGVLLWVVIVFL